jgi:hypothetical protein
MAKMPANAEVQYSLSVTGYFGISLQKRRKKNRNFSYLQSVTTFKVFNLSLRTNH